MAFSLVGKNTYVISAYLLLAYVGTIFFLVPYWAFQYIMPESRPRKSWSLKDTIAMRLLHRAGSVLFETGWPSPPDANKVAAEAKNSEEDNGFVWVKPLPVECIKGWVAIAATENNVLPAKVSGYWYGKREGGRADYVAKENEKVIYELHSGAYVAGSAHPKHDVTPVIPNLLQKCSKIASRAFSIEYRLCSAEPFPALNPFPASLLDALAGYRYLVEEMKFKPENIFIEGFSAGAHLAIDLVLYLKQNKIPSLPPPKAVLLISPMVDLGLTHSGPGSSVEKFKEIDVLSNVLQSGYPARALRGSISETEFVSNAYLSPGSKQVGSWLASTFCGWPQTCMITGDSEAILDGANSFWAKLLQDNEGKGMEWFRYMQYDDMPHGFVAPYAFSKQRDQALADVGKWMQSVISS